MRVKVGVKHEDALAEADVFVKLSQDENKNIQLSFIVQDMTNSKGNTDC